ncbi:MAG TPA: hypothetical protein VLV18_03340 [Terriglobales bacterium]|nr:hypothetical protein [Terriglobales bacterium]
MVWQFNQYVSPLFLGTWVYAGLALLVLRRRRHSKSDFLSFLVRVDLHSFYRLCGSIEVS